MLDKVKIKINIAERQYSFAEETGKEETIRLAARNINERLLLLKQAFPRQDMQDWLSAACMWFAMKLIEVEAKLEADAVALDDAVKGMQELEAQIADYVDVCNQNNV
jgi:cell division protein ZapA (FtsZ GTPase activity inhibitor)